LKQKHEEVIELTMKTRQLFIFVIFLTFSEILFAQNVKDMYPQLGRSLDFEPKIGEQWEKADKIMEDIQWDYTKLTTENKKFFEQINYMYESEVEQGYYDAIGGGCSWYCGGGPDSISASSYLKSTNTAINYLPENIHDLSFKTAWVEGVKGYGIGEYIVYHFNQTAPRITKIIIANGYVKSEKAYRENSRVKKLKLYLDDKPFAILNLEDSRREQTFEFEPIGRKRPINVDWKELDKLPKWTLKFEILEIYQGEKYDDVAISEIYFDGIDVHCFAEGTKILMADNSLKNIELIQEGDMVKSYDFENKNLINSKVTKLISVTHSNLLKLKFTDNEIVTTADHPFWIEKNVWAAVDAPKANKYYFQEAEIESLKIGDKIFIPEKNVFSEIIDIENINVKQNTYTIELAESDNFIANGMLVKTEIVK
jgi:Hom_end-associated Hint./Nicotine adenine dinucleotide glycohydrolase (NADase).